MSFYSTAIDEHKNNQKVLFDTIDKMLQRKIEKLYPSNDSTQKLADAFADFFTDKITKFRDDLTVQTPTSNINQGNCYPSTTEFAHFTPVTEEQLPRMIKYIASKSCELDPFPAYVLKRCLHPYTTPCN